MAFTVSREQQAATPRATAPKKIHLAFLDGIRACAALYIVCHHAINFGTMSCFPAANGQESCSSNAASSSNVLVNLINWLFHSFGQEAVAVFICLSGFCLMIPVVRNIRIGEIKIESVPFFVKRAKRILPPYFASVILSLALIATVIGVHTNGVWDLCLPDHARRIVTGFDLFTHIFLIQDFFNPANGRINGPLWSVAAEWRIYFLFPLLIWAWKKFGPLGTTICVAVGACLAHPMLPRLFRHLPIAIHIGPTQFVPEYFALFAFGALAAGISMTSGDRISALRQRIPWGFLAAIPIASVVIARSEIGERAMARMPDYYGSTDLIINLLVGIGASALMAGLTLGRWQAMRNIFGCRPLVFAGTISYSLYLTHYPIEQVLLQYAVVPMHISPLGDGLVMVPLSLVVTLGFAYIFYRAVELPSHRWATKRTATDKAVIKEISASVDARPPAA